MLLSDESAVNKKTQVDRSLFFPDVVEIGGAQSHASNRARSGSQGPGSQPSGRFPAKSRSSLLASPFPLLIPHLGFQSPRILGLTSKRACRAHRWGSTSSDLQPEEMGSPESYVHCSVTLFLDCRTPKAWMLVAPDHARAFYVINPHILCHVF